MGLNPTAKQTIPAREPDHTKECNVATNMSFASDGPWGPFWNFWKLGKNRFPIFYTFYIYQTEIPKKTKQIGVTTKKRFHLSLVLTWNCSVIYSFWSRMYSLRASWSICSCKFCFCSSVTGVESNSLISSVTSCDSVDSAASDFYAWIVPFLSIFSIS